MSTFHELFYNPAESDIDGKTADIFGAILAVGGIGLFLKAKSYKGMLAGLASAVLGGAILAPSVNQYIEKDEQAFIDSQR